ncbi:AAA family ATPase [Streptomyces sp. NPDC048644]|uniref:AAA family ATPase n=1 Tax=Streptomyces sp. NPDC048644 TaxID=3365582 RepID=UPI00371E6C18
MSAASTPRAGWRLPQDRSWVVAVLSDDDATPVGAGFVIDDERILTCSHICGSETVRVRFPMVPGQPVRRALVVARGTAEQDLAVLRVDADAGMPPGVRPPALRCPRPEDLEGGSWWAFGFPGGDPLGDSARGEIGSALGHGWVRLDTAPSHRIERGFSGAGLWCAPYGALVGVVAQAGGGNGRAVTLFEAGDLHGLATCRPPDAGPGWTLDGDTQAARHWRPRARGVAVDSEGGWRFRGRTAALHRIVEWFRQREDHRQVLMVTGSPGVGKSAVLARIVTTADPAVGALLPADDDAVRADEGSIGCAVFARGRTALEVASEIARAASAHVPEQLQDFPAFMARALTAGTPFNVVIDALDEAASPEQARLIIRMVARPLAETVPCARVVVGARHRDDLGDLLGAFRAGRVTIDLDSPAYFAPADLEAYALATLRLSGNERAGNPYADGAVARPVARRIAERSARNFLVAGLVARSHGLYDTEPVDPDALTFSPDVDEVLHAYLERLVPPVAGGAVSAAGALTALAFAHMPGFTAPLWSTAIGALHDASVDPQALARFARSAAANFLIESGSDPDGRTFRLFHQALVDSLLAQRADWKERATDERALTRAFLTSW